MKNKIVNMMLISAVILSVSACGKDITAPIITGEDTYEAELYEGISYKKLVEVTDESGDEVELSIDNSQVDINIEGRYPVYYTATDTSGNVSTKEVTIVVYKKDISEEEVLEKAEEIVSEIIEETMTDEEKVKAIFDWVFTNVWYQDRTTRDSWVQGAGEGLISSVGDCYTYAMTTKVLLDTAEIKNMDIEKIPDEKVHFWNLVDVGDGWVHVDTTNRADGIEICMWNDQDVMEYSDNNNNSHNYDKDAYPDIN